MTPARAAELDAFQARLERCGWRFDSQYLPGVCKYSWAAYKRVWGMCENFVRADRDDARAHALQWAEMTEAAVQEDRPTMPAPAPEANHAAE